MKSGGEIKFKFKIKMNQKAPKNEQKVSRTIFKYSINYTSKTSMYHNLKVSYYLKLKSQTLTSIFIATNHLQPQKLYFQVQY